MKPEEQDDLMQRVLEGQASSREQSQLNASLESDPDLQARYRVLQTLFHELGRLEDLEPPAGLGLDIARAVHASAAEPTPDRWPHFPALRAGRIRELFTPGRVFAFSLGAAACFAVMLAAGKQNGLDAGKVAGSMIVRGSESPSAVQTSRRLDFEGGHAQLRTIAEHRTMFIEIQLDCASLVRLALQTSPGTSMRGFDRPSGGKPALVDGTGITFEQAAPGRYVFAIESGTDARGFVMVTVGSGAQALRAELPVPAW